MRFRSFVFFIGLVVTGLTYGQQVDPESRLTPPIADNRIKVVVEVVSVDAIVTDKAGRHVKDLGMSDFEVYQDGEPQEITNFSYVNAVPEPTSGAAIDVGEEDSSAVRNVVPQVQGLPVQRKDILRSIALVVDDIGMSFENLVFVRQALRKFVQEQIYPSDLVAISMTGSRTGALSQFTTDKDLLNAAVDRIRWGAVHRARAYDKGSFDRQFSDMKRGETIEERSLAVGTLQSLRYKLNSMEDLPGRKSVILVSEGFRLWYDELEGVGGSTNYMVESLREVMHAAHRSGAVIYAVDPRGGESLGLHPRDDLSGVVSIAQEVYEEVKNVMANVPDTASGWALIERRAVDSYRLQTMSIEDIKTLLDPEAFAKISSTRLNQFYQTQQGLNYLPVATGGLYLKYNNDINTDLGHILSDQQGYYLIGYAPDPESIRSRGSRRFPKINVKVKRDGLEVRGRATFMGTLDSDKANHEPTPEERMYEYMASPFTSGQIDLELTSLYEHDPREGAFISSWLHVDSKGLTFSAEEDGWKKAEVEVWAAAFGEKPKPEEEKRETFSVRVRGQSYERVLRDGLVCKVRLPAEGPGPCQLRIVVHDKASGRIGSASSFLQVLDIQAGRLALSGIVVRGSGSGPGLPETGDMALRRFRRGSFLNYSLYIYNAQLDSATRNPQLETQVKLFRDGQEIYSGSKKKFDLNGKLEESVLIGSGYLQLGAEMHTGHYAMQYTVTDKLADDGYGTVSQWIDFQILD
jgi:VWFA-related protein